MIGVAIPVTPVRRQIAFTEPVAGLPARSPSLTIDFPSSFYFHPEGAGLLLGWSDPRQEPGFNLKFELDDWLMGVGQIAARCAPAVLDYGIRTGWAGLYEVTPDCNQIIDRPGEVEGLLIATGYSGHACGVPVERRGQVVGQHLVGVHRVDSRGEFAGVVEVGGLGLHPQDVGERCGGQ